MFHIFIIDVTHLSISTQKYCVWLKINITFMIGIANQGTIGIYYLYLKIYKMIKYVYTLSIRMGTKKK